MTGDGQVLSDSLRIDSYKLNEAKTPVFLFDQRIFTVCTLSYFSYLKGQADLPVIPPFEFVGLSEHGLESIPFVPPSAAPIDSRQPALSVLDNHHMACEAKHYHATNLLDNLKAIPAAIDSCLAHHNSQLSAFKVCPCLIAI